MPKKRSTKRGPNVWVVRRGGQFSVKPEGRAAYLTVPIAQEKAISIARMIAKINRSELIIQGEDGRIRARDSEGSDPFPPKG